MNFSKVSLDCLVDLILNESVMLLNSEIIQNFIIKEIKERFKQELTGNEPNSGNDENKGFSTNFIIKLLSKLLLLIRMLLEK